MGTVSHDPSLAGRIKVLQVRPATDDDRPWIVEVARRRLGSEHQVHTRRQFRVDEHAGFVAEAEGTRVGFVVWIAEPPDAEVLAIAVDAPRLGAGRALMAAAGEAALAQGCDRLALTTTDENVGAQRFYEALGFTLGERLVGAVDRCRELYKPEIPAGIHDELVYERRLP